MKIHLHSKEGLYTVKCYSPYSITVFTKQKEFTVPTSDFKSFAGGLWNSQVSKKDMDEFLSTIKDMNEFLSTLDCVEEINKEHELECERRNEEDEFWLHVSELEECERRNEENEWLMQRLSSHENEEGKEYLHDYVYGIFEIIQNYETRGIQTYFYVENHFLISAGVYSTVEKANEAIKELCEDKANFLLNICENDDCVKQAIRIRNNITSITRSLYYDDVTYDSPIYIVEKIPVH